MRSIDSKSWCMLVALLALAGGTGCAVPSPTAIERPTRLMTPQAFQALPSKRPDWRISYGSDPNQFGELRVPTGPGPHPVAILVHGGCFKAAYATLRDLAPMGDALKELGIASWNIEYRRGATGAAAGRRPISM